jgi:hypothetical protein
MTAPIVHGTYAGYQAHVNRVNKTEPCWPCQQAAAEYKRTWREKRAGTPLAAKEVEARRLRDMRKHLAKPVRIPGEVLVELYVSAPPAQQEQLEELLGTSILDKLVGIYDEVAA